MSASAGCIYCGLPRARVRAGGRIVRLMVCVAHTDLPALDPALGLVESLMRAPRAAKGDLTLLEVDAAREQAR